MPDDVLRRQISCQLLLLDFDWHCGGMSGVASWLVRVATVLKTLGLNPAHWFMIITYLSLVVVLED